MSNMSYCRFENTLSDLEDCVCAMTDADSLEALDLSDTEDASYRAMYRAAQAFIEEYDRLSSR